MVREYDQDGSDSSTRRPTELEAEQADPEEEDIRAQIKRLEDELNLMKQGPFGPNSEFMQSLPKDERAQLLKALEAEGSQSEIEKLLEEDDEVEYIGDELGEGETENGVYGEEEEDVEEEGEDNVVEEPLAVTLRFPSQHKKYVKEFNDALLLAQNEIHRFSYHLDLWKWYLRCQQHIPSFSHFVDEDVWDFLWNSQTVYFPRPKQIVMLAKDMLSAGIKLDVPQTLDYIDALHMTGDTVTAIQAWEDTKHDVRPHDEAAGRFWASGITIYAAVGRPRKAQDIASNAYKSGALGVEAWIPVIQSWANSKKASAGSSLWACYLRLKQQHSEMAAKDRMAPSHRLPTQILGQISSALLNSGRQDMAISVFKDILASDANEQFDSAQVYANTLNRLQGVDKVEVSESIINRIGLAALTSFPGRFKNKFFFGAWIKWLIGEGKVNDAALVVELMQEYGIRPDAKHLNGVVGAWLREGSSSARDRAEQMAWAMIHARIAQVKSRTLPSSSSTTVVNEQNPYSNFPRLPRFLQRNVPPATIETFSVLLQRYTRLSDVTKSEHLTDIMTGPAQIKPNAFILNHWMYLSLRTQNLPAMWQRYTAVKRDIEPDLETFAVLWEGCKKNLDRATSTRTSEYPTPRQLARETKMWFDGLSPQKQLDAKEGTTEGLYEEIVRSFCLYSDIPGTFVALRLLQSMFDMYPHDDISRMILMAVARMYPSHSPLASKSRRAAIRRRDSSYRSALGNLAGVMQGIADAKASEAIAQGASGEEVEDTESVIAANVRLQTIQVFLAMVLRRRTHASSGHLGNELAIAGRALGVELIGDDVRGVIEEAEAYERVEALPRE